MATVAANKAGIEWGKVLRWTTRFVWATTMFIAKIVFIFLTYIAAFVIARLSSSENSAEQDDDFERRRREYNEDDCHQFMDDQRRGGL